MQSIKPPVLSHLTGHNVVVDFEDTMQSIVKVSRGQSLHKAAIESAIERALQDLGSSEDLVRTIVTWYICDSMINFRNDAYLYSHCFIVCFCRLIFGHHSFS